MARSLELDSLRVRGRSRAGQQTWFRIDPPALGLDAGRGAPELVGVPRVFLSHGHLDHAGGLPWIASQRRGQGLSTLTVYTHPEVAGPLAELVAAAGRLEGRELEVEIVPILPGETVALGKGFELEAFAVDHGTSALGCHLLRERRRLREDLRALSGPEIAARRARGESVDEVEHELWLTYCGDTGAAVFDTEPRVYRSRYLLLECTFASDATRESARQFGHLHLDDLVERQEFFDNEVLVLCHLSRRHRESEFRDLLAARLSDLRPRLELLV